MGRCNSVADLHFFSLTSLQIGDLQSYLSDLSLFLAPESKNFYILVDNRPWLEDLVSRPAHLWQLMVTKSRLSPFANTRGQKGRKETREFTKLKAGSKTNSSRSQDLKRWFSLLDAASLSRERALLPVKKLKNNLLLNSKLRRTLYGFIVFEVSWTDVRGINYLNELQTDTSLAIESKFMRRWEFDSIEQAAGCISSWFPGTLKEQLLLEEHLNSTIGDVFYDAPASFSECSTIDEDILNVDQSDGDESPCSIREGFSVYSTSSVTRSNLLYTPPPDGPYKRRKLSESMSVNIELDVSSEDHSDSLDSHMCSPDSYTSSYEDLSEAILYRDVLLMIRFDDRDLPFKLKEIIMLDLRLLTLLESGLPSWVIFLQSYPGFCHLYRPWMCPLARALYFVVSFVTVLIGFYDLYKNVPVLKATAYSLFGPLLDWIETWEMVSRIRYLGTMLFLHNFQKALKYFLTVTRTIRSCLSILTQPLAGPFLVLLEVILPFWKLFIDICEDIFSVIWILIESSWNIVETCFEFVLLPVWFIISVVQIIATSIVYPIFWFLREILYAPIRLLLGFSNLLAFICAIIYDAVRDIWLLTSGIFKVASNAEATISTYEVPMWRALWNDLFSQIFRAVRSILNGLVAFFTACNRHRLSIYNHSQEFIRRHYRPVQRIQPSNCSRREKTSETKNTSGCRQEWPFQMKHVKQI